MASDCSAAVIHEGGANDVTPPKSPGMKAVWARPDSRFHPAVGDAIPDHVVDDFVELRRILRSEYGLAV